LEGIPTAVTDKIEILSVSLLDEHRLHVEQLKDLANCLGIGIGWHYLLDWAWMLSLLGNTAGKHLVDAGAGEGLLQWYLAEQGAEIISVDRSSRTELSLRFRARYNVGGLRPEDLVSPLKVLMKRLSNASGGKEKITSFVRGIGGLIKISLPKSYRGKVVIYNQDLAAMPLIPSNSIDAVLAVSALEHNSPSELASVVDELMRVLKPGGALLATLGAARDSDWFHEPSKGWCYTDASLRRLFRLSDEATSNYTHYNELFSELKSCDELRLGLANFYFRSGDNGMPWGKWDPQYQPVGVYKIKSS
jgi:SAM-dependent methyltransferase